MTVFCLASAFSTKTVQTKQNDYLLFNKADGVLPHHKTGRHRRVFFADLIKYKNQRLQGSLAAMKELADFSQELED
ncbi:hypothetical protein [Pantoea stewartii]